MQRHRTVEVSCLVLTWLVVAAAEEAAFGGEWPTAPFMTGDCSTVWTTSFAKYTMPYKVQWASRGSFRWRAPYKDGLATEVGEGTYLSKPVTTVRPDGSWESHYFSANRFLPDPDAATICACEYVGGASPDGVKVLADYIVAKVPRSDTRPMQDVCAPFIQQCPPDNATALRELGSPFIEVYESCGPPVFQEWTVGVMALACCVGAGLLALLSLGLHSLWRRLREGERPRAVPADGVTGPLTESLLRAEEEGVVAFGALRGSLHEQLFPGCKGSDGRDRDADACSTASTAVGSMASPSISEASWHSWSWSRRSTMEALSEPRSRGNSQEELPGPGWKRSMTERATDLDFPSARRQMTN